MDYAVVPGLITERETAATFSCVRACRLRVVGTRNLLRRPGVARLFSASEKRLTGRQALRASLSPSNARSFDKSLE